PVCGSGRIASSGCGYGIPLHHQCGCARHGTDSEPGCCSLVDRLRASGLSQAYDSKHRHPHATRWTQKMTQTARRQAMVRRCIPIVAVVLAVLCEGGCTGTTGSPSMGTASSMRTGAAGGEVGGITEGGDGPFPTFPAPGNTACWRDRMSNFGTNP